MQSDHAPSFDGGSSSAAEALFRFVFSRAPDVAGELQALLPSEMLDRLELPGLSLQPADTSDSCGLLYSVPLGAREALVYLRLEHGGARTLTPLALLECLLHIWRQRALALPERPLPVIIPLVVHQGERRRRGPRSLCDLFEVDLATWVAVSPLIPDFEFLVDDLASVGAASLRARAQLSHFARLALFLLQRAVRAPDLVVELAEWSGPMAALLREQGGTNDFAVLLGYMFSVAGVSVERLGVLLAEQVGTLAEEIMVTTKERLIARGRAEGECEGHARGEREGRAASLLRLLSLRLGELTHADRERIRSASAAELERWTERVLSVASPAELFD